ELGLGGGAAVTGVAALTRPGDGRHDPVRVDLADRVVVAVGDVEVPLSIEGDAHRRLEDSLGRRSTVPALGLDAGDPRTRHERSRGSDTRDRRDAAVRVDLSDHVVAVIGDVQVALPVERNGTWA